MVEANVGEISVQTIDWSGRIEVGGLTGPRRLLCYVLALGMVLGLSDVANAEVFHVELSKGDWNSSGYAFELSLASFSS